MCCVSRYGKFLSKIIEIFRLKPIKNDERIIGVEISNSDLDRKKNKIAVKAISIKKVDSLS